MSLQIDWLSQLLEMLNIRGQLDIRCNYGAPWQVTLDHSPQGEIPYHIILAGSAVLEDSKGKPVRQLSVGDILIVPHGSPHVLHDGDSAKPARVKVESDVNLIVSRNSGKGEQLDMLCGRFILPPPHARIMREYFPKWLVITTSLFSNRNLESFSLRQLKALVELMRFESTDGNLGGGAMLNSLSTALFILTLRHASESEEAPKGLLALAGNPRLAPALSGLLNNPSHTWTLPELAERCSMSRATFVRHFQKSMGHSANEFLTDIRMTSAANQLKKTSISTEAIADATGYQSEAAFQRAFKQRMGITPAQWRRSEN